MKFKVTMKDPDGVYDCIVDAAKASVKAMPDLIGDERDILREQRIQWLNQVCSKWFEFDEYLTVEIDTDADTITVCKVD